MTTYKPTVDMSCTMSCTLVFTVHSITASNYATGEGRVKNYMMTARLAFPFLLHLAATNTDHPSCSQQSLLLDL